jgi:hypothetical protein
LSEHQRQCTVDDVKIMCVDSGSEVCMNFRGLPPTTSN